MMLVQSVLFLLIIGASQGKFNAFLLCNVLCICNITKINSVFTRLTVDKKSLLKISYLYLQQCCYQERLFHYSWIFIKIETRL